ncbi:16S rRNA (cytosine(1402)-N(4))-methyltransferase RsmH [Leptospira sp. GIMC2001]|uniref:16S rRNA (cytosine(1402)-N(4))-methyltransferase RsmH n=1 Tax=Leptospira sp. GIMC2001 TaxID=1513297 RepID=UPI002349F560|nr:16S rRNA (cytosine(1402)-N(4))-methyltransferase RsmH [Leptospira sp. GIMC2001]WCL47980.1 16S rRNA (cytosine(1402)-N(4))-methyltransferase RsmH [Leptospira sp. GIMC2001]
MEEFSVTHYPVLAKEIIDTYLDNFAQDRPLRFIDGTGGEGGHVLEVLNAFPTSEILVLDRDPIMLSRIESRIPDKKNITTKLLNYSELTSEDLKERGWENGLADGILLDLGISTFHIIESGRGFSFRGTEPLDMRLDQSLSGRENSAADLVNNYPAKELERIFYEFGEERWTKKIVERIIEKRKNNPIESNYDLAKIVESAIPRKFWPPKSHPAFRVFQALRIEVNQELEHLKKAVSQLPFLLNPKGIIQIISFHSLEDRIVKHEFRNIIQTKDDFRFIYKKPVLPSELEIEKNPPSRSAKLRAIQRSSDTKKYKAGK